MVGIVLVISLTRPTVVEVIALVDVISLKGVMIDLSLVISSLMGVLPLLMGLDVISLLGVVLSVMPILIDLICVLSRLMGLGDVKLLFVVISVVMSLLVVLVEVLSLMDFVGSIFMVTGSVHIKLYYILKEIPYYTVRGENEIQY